MLKIEVIVWLTVNCNQDSFFVKHMRLKKRKELKKCRWRGILKDDEIGECQKMRKKNRSNVY